MPLRQCPKCDSRHYSSSNVKWRCGECGMILDSSHDVKETNEGAESNGRSYLQRHH